MQQLRPGKVPEAAYRSATLHDRGRKNCQPKIPNVTHEREKKIIRLKYQPFQSAATFSLVTTAPHSTEVVRTTLHPTQTELWTSQSNQNKGNF